MLHWPHALVCVVCLLGCKAAGADGEALIESVGQGQVAFRRKEVVETALAHTGAVADFLHADIAVAARVTQVAGAVDQALPIEIHSIRHTRMQAVTIQIVQFVDIDRSTLRRKLADYEIDS